MKNIIIACFVAALFVPSGAWAMKCDKCHSKNPKMVKMHDALGNKDCFKCHFRGLKRTKEETEQLKASDERCVSCHQVKNTAPAEPAAKK
jgi:hypothetical protein